MGKCLSYRIFVADGLKYLRWFPIEWAYKGVGVHKLEGGFSAPLSRGVKGGNGCFRDAVCGSSLFYSPGPVNVILKMCKGDLGCKLDLSPVCFKIAMCLTHYSVRLNGQILSRWVILWMLCALLEEYSYHIAK